MGSETSRLLAVVLSCAAGALAQNPTVPATMVGVEGGGGTNIPFGSNLACRYQILYEQEELPWVGPRVITGISLRADNSPPGGTIAAKQYLDISVLVSTSPKTSATVSSTFADNYGVDATWVVNHQLTQLPAQGVVSAGPRPANIDFMFTTPWAYGLTPAIGTSPPPSSLLIEIWIHSQPPGTYRIDNLSSCVAPNWTFGNQGPACAVAGKPPIELTADVTMLAGSSYSWHVANADPNALFLLWLSPTATGGLFGAPSLALPFALFDPANPSQPPPALPVLGQSAPDCWINVDPLFWLAGVCDATGHGTTSLVLAAGRDVVGTTYHAQAIVAAPTVNPLLLITSQGRATTVCGPLGVARVYSFYNTTATPPQTLPTTGSVQLGVGPVLEVH